jgi:hypothetical protein
MVPLRASKVGCDLLGPLVGRIHERDAILSLNSFKSLTAL